MHRPCVNAHPKPSYLLESSVILHFPVGSLHLEEELELEATEERQLKLPREKWVLDDIKRSLLLVSDDVWFHEGEGMIDISVLGPSRPSIFRRVFSGVPGAIYGCLKVGRCVERQNR